ncbi:hypothetical protein QVD17_29998 [Tagetes erecta]|uniref:Reverse transcriptase zinc-binding domain-containing protein n=1 Tax=Tagetes erecta TaxID=13708 RepID=A0AAD8NFM0_TARER|nr:hypothetical protein QVD17_29998 [Tagetes erecta]
MPLVPLKIRSFVLATRGVALDDEECSMCIGASESAPRLLVSCPFAARVWQSVSEWCGINIEVANYVRDFKEVMDNEVGSSELKNALCAIVMATVWFFGLSGTKGPLMTSMSRCKA